MEPQITQTTEVALIPPSSIVCRDLAEVQAQARERVRELIDQTTAANTKAAYASDWQHFAEWCTALGVCALPASVDTIITYVSELPTMPNRERHGRGMRREAKHGYSVATIARRLATIGARHKDAELENPCSHAHVHKLLRGIRREKGTAPKRKAALLTDHLRRLRRESSGSVRELRDRAVILVGYAGAFRRSELVALNVADCVFGERTLTITLRKSKTDQESHGRTVVIHAGGVLCPIEALRAWLTAAAIVDSRYLNPASRVLSEQSSHAAAQTVKVEGAVFRSVRSNGKVGKRLPAESVSHIVKSYAETAGLAAGDFAGHSLRAGHVTTAILRGESAHAIMAVTGHQSRAMVDRYFRDVEPRRHNSSANLGL